MIDGCDEVCGILGAVNIEVPLAGQQFRHTVSQVRTQNSSQDTLLNRFIKSGQATGEEGEGCVADDILGAAGLQLACNLQHGIAGRNDIVRDKYGLTFNAFAQILMCNNGIAAINHAGVVTALIEHTQIAAQNTGEIHITVQRTFIGADDHEVVLIEGQVRHISQQSLQNLISGHDVIKAHQGNRVHQAGVMGIKGNDILWGYLKPSYPHKRELCHRRY